MFLYAAAVLALLALVFLPQWWVHAVLKRHSAPRGDLKFTGGALARRLLDERGLHAVKVEGTGEGDHYDPGTKAVRLSPENLEGRSVTALAVAAHEVGHALQDAEHDPRLIRRTQLARATQWAMPLGGVLLMASLFVGPLGGKIGMLAMALGAVLVMGLPVLVHWTTLPTEWDASFGRAMPMLEQGGYLEGSDLSAARQVLKAAAYTYVAAALIAIISLARWLRPGRF